MAKSVLEGAQLAKAPIFLQTNMKNLKNFPGTTHPGEQLNKLIKNYDLPIAIHLDHASEISIISDAYQNHYSSFMLDYSNYSLEKNIAKIEKVTKKFNFVKIGLEAELGVIEGQSELFDKNEDNALYTDPCQASIFIQKTKIDSLAISIGSKHGLGSAINYKILAKIHKKINKPLVVHGGSGIEKDNYVKLNNFGVKKINFGTKIHKIFSDESKHNELANYVKSICYNLHADNKI
jgi:fructose-bisphosphate aldolase class II